MGLFDLPTPAFAALDDALGHVLPPFVRFAAWGVLGGILSMFIYHFLSPQVRIRAAKRRAAAARRRLRNETENFSRAMPFVLAQLGAALRHLGLALPSAFAALLPALSLTIWLDTAYSYGLPSDERPITVVPARFTGSLTTVDGAARLRVYGEDARVVADLPLKASIPRVEKRHWWNALVANPAGYLPSHGEVESVTIDLPRREYLPFGPSMLRAWWAAFLPAMVIASLACHRLLRTA